MTISFARARFNVIINLLIYLHNLPVFYDVHYNDNLNYKMIISEYKARENLLVKMLVSCALIKS